MVTIRCKDVTFQNIEAIIFDKDGTLADSAAFLRNLGQRRARIIDAQIPGVQEPLLMAFGIDNDRLNPAGLLAVGTRRENEIAAAAYVAETGRDWLKALELVHSAFIEADKVMKRKADHTPLFAGGLEMIQRLTAAKVKLGILSSDTTDHVKDFVERYQLAPYFQLQAGTDGSLGKPDPSLLQDACNMLKVPPIATLVIGDSQADIQLAHAAGSAGCAAVTWGWSTELQLTGADVVINAFEQIQVSN